MAHISNTFCNCFYNFIVYKKKYFVTFHKGRIVTNSRKKMISNSLKMSAGVGAALYEGRKMMMIVSASSYKDSTVWKPRGMRRANKSKLLVQKNKQKTTRSKY